MPKESRRVMLFDLDSSGHHLQYLSQLASFWVRREVEGHLDIVVPSHFVEAHPEFRAFIDHHRLASRINLVIIEEEVVSVDGSKRWGRMRNDFRSGRLLKKYVSKLRPDFCVIMVFDNVQISLALGLRFGFQVRLSGIYFRPSFYYDSFSRNDKRLSEKLKRIGKRLILWAALRNPTFTDLFCLDPYVVPHIHGHGTLATFLPDGINFSDLEIDASDTAAQGATRESMQKTWGVETGRKVALFFGGISGRKGVFQVLESVQYLDTEIQDKLCLVFVGVINAPEREDILSRLDSVKQSSAVQIIVWDRFVDMKDIQGIIRGADLALITYQRHVGSSGVLIRAAAEQIPVLGPDYGLIGVHIVRHRLGLSVDTTSPVEIARGLSQFVLDAASWEFDAAAARAFALENTAERFCTTIFGRS